MDAERLTIETARLLLRPLEERDVPDLVEYLSQDDPMIRRVVKPDATPDAVREYWGKMRELSPYGDPEWYSMLIELRAEKKVIGNCGFGIERIGMRREAHFREGHTNLDHEWADEYVYAMLRSEWVSDRPEG